MDGNKKTFKVNKYMRRREAFDSNLNMKLKTCQGVNCQKRKYTDILLLLIK